MVNPAALDLTLPPHHLPPPAQALLGEPLTMFGDGKQTRSFQHVSDLVAGMVAVMDNDEHLGPFNVGNPGVSPEKYIPAASLVGRSKQKAPWIPTTHKPTTHPTTHPTSQPTNQPTPD